MANFNALNTVTANPTAEATQKLEKLQVGNTVYETGGGSGGGNYVLELTGESGTLTDEQYQAVVDNFPNVVVKRFLQGNDFEFYYPFLQSGNIYNFFITYYNELINIKFIATLIFTIHGNKTWDIGTVNHQFSAVQVKQITFTDRPSLWTWLQSNWEKILIGVAKMGAKTLNFNTIQDAKSDGVLTSIYISRTNLTYYSATNEVYSDTVKITATNVELKLGANIRVLPDGTVASNAPTIQVLEDSHWSVLDVSITITYIE